MGLITQNAGSLFCLEELGALAFSPYQFEALRQEMAIRVSRKPIEKTEERAEFPEEASIAWAAGFIVTDSPNFDLTAFLQRLNNANSRNPFFSLMLRNKQQGIEGRPEDIAIWNVIGYLCKCVTLDHNKFTATLGGETVNNPGNHSKDGDGLAFSRAAYLRVLRKHNYFGLGGIPLWLEDLAEQDEDEDERPRDEEAAPASPVPQTAKTVTPEPAEATTTQKAAATPATVADSPDDDTPGLTMSPPSDLDASPADCIYKLIHRWRSLPLDQKKELGEKKLKEWLGKNANIYHWGTDPGGAMSETQFKKIKALFFPSTAGGSGNANIFR